MRQKGCTTNINLERISETFTLLSKPEIARIRKFWPHISNFEKKYG